MLAVKAFEERKFLADLQREIRESDLFDWVDDAQVIVLDREPEEGDLVILYPPSVIIIPTLWEPDYGLGGTTWLGYPARFLCIAETLDSSEDEDRWTDATAGGAAIREKTLIGLAQLGDDEDGAFNLSGGGSIDYLEPGPSGPPVRLRLGDEGQLDLCVPELIVVYHLHF